MNTQQNWLRAGVFLTSLATLLLELLDARLLSVLAWYHLSFLAVSLAMLGMAAGAVWVFRRGECAYAENGMRLLGRYGILFSASIPVTHLLNLLIPMPAISGIDPKGIACIATAVAVLTVPFFLSGVVLTLILTRIGKRIGLLYGCDLLGAACGCLVIIPLLDYTDITTATLICAAIAGGAAICFSRIVAPTSNRRIVALGLFLLAAAGVNTTFGTVKSLVYLREKQPAVDAIQFAKWNAYSYVAAKPIKEGKPFMWGTGEGFPEIRLQSIDLLIDGLAGTSVTAWDRSVDSLYWTRYDVTSLPYHFRKGEVAIIGGGGGRDILSAIYGGNRSIDAIEMNTTFIDLLQGRLREFAAIADQKTVRLINDEARSYLTRSARRFDIIQMSLIDTWAATGAGAYTLSENGLYTVEAWLVFLRRLKSRGVLSVSRWFLPSNVSETSRLASLSVHTLINLGIKIPAKHMVLASRGFVATLLVSPSPFSRADLKQLWETAADYGFTILAAPGFASPVPLLGKIIASRSIEELQRATADPNFDYSAPTDARPYFFNMLKLSAYQWFDASRLGVNALGLGGVLVGNLRATTSLLLLFLIAAIFVSAIILYPLVRSGMPAMKPSGLMLCIAYFASIGAGFMLIQISFLEIFSIFLGHPIYTFSIILFSMILFAGVGSTLSDRLTIQGKPWHYGVPLAICSGIFLLQISLQPVLDRTIQLELPARCAIVIALIAPLSILLGCCFPIGIRLVNRISKDAAAFCWGINGAVSVLASIAAVGVSLWWGIYNNFVIAAALYLVLSPVAFWLYPSGSSVQPR